MRITIRCGSAMIMKNEEGEIVVSMIDVNEDDVMGANCMIQNSKQWSAEEIDELVLNPIKE